MNGGLQLRPVHFKEACSFIMDHHRHHSPPQGYKYAVAVSKDSLIVGVAIVGRPVSRYLDDGSTLEITRLCTDGTKNACSKLYAACRRIAKEMGYRELITYILSSETGASLKAAGWTRIGQAGGKSWNVPSRPRVDKSPKELKVKYSVTLQ